jgi:Flp pilus assembly pilin Flp
VYDQSTTTHQGHGQMRLHPISQQARHLIADESGGTHIEYALIGGFTGVLLLGGLLSLRDGLDTFYVGLAGLLSAVL